MQHSAAESYAASTYPPLPPIADSENIASMVMREWPTFGEQPAIIDGTTGTTRTYAELTAGVDALAAHLVGLGLTPGQLVALVSPNDLDYATVLLAALKLGLTVSPMNPTLTADEMELQLRDAHVAMVVGSPLCPQAHEAAARVASVRQILSLGPELGEIVSSRPEIASSGQLPPAFPSPTADAMAILPYSSGTTGTPKGTMLSHRNIIANLLQLLPLDGAFYQPDEVVLSPGPMFHIYPLTIGLLFHLWRGTPYVFMSGPFSVASFCAVVARTRATRAHVSPPIVTLLAKSAEVDVGQLATLRMMLSAAAPLYASLEEECAARVGCPIKQAWGMSELSPLGTIVPDDARRGGSIGVAVPSTELKVARIDTEGDIDPRAPAVPRGERGELLVRGPQVMHGYLHAPAKTAETLLEDGWLRTGDVVTMDADGYVFIADRLKELIKYKGHQVAPAELEDLLRTHPKIADAAVIPKPDEVAGETPRAYVVPKPGEQLSEEEVVAFVDERVSAFKKLRGGAVITDAIPKTGSGKILRRLVIAKDRA